MGRAQGWRDIPLRRVSWPGVRADTSTDPVETQPKGKQATAKWYLVRTRGPELARIADLVDERGWRPAIDSVHAFDGFQAAYGRVDGAAAGKVVVTVSEDA